MKIKDLLPVMHTRGGFNSLLATKVREASERAAANVEIELKNEIEDLRDTVESINPQMLNKQDDTFYKTLYASYFGKGEKEDPEENLTETVKFARAKGYMTAYNVPMDRHQSDEMRKYAQTIAYVRAFEDPIIGAIPDAYQRFTLGRGIKFRCDDVKVQARLEEFWQKNKMDMYTKRAVWLLVTESEFFPLYFISSKTGDVKVREIQPAEISVIETNPEDKSIPLSYKREFVDTEGVITHFKKEKSEIRYYADIDYFTQKEDELDGQKSINDKRGKGWQGKYKLVQFIKLMKNREVRSRVFLERVLKWAEFYKNWIVDRAIINHEIGRVVWILEISGRRSESWTRYKPAPAGGTVKISTPDRKWVPTNAKINAPDVKEDGLFLLYQVCAGVSLPIHVITQRATEAVYSSLNKSESPMTMAILDLQDTITESFLKPMFKLVIRSAVNASEKSLSKKLKIRKYVNEYLVEVFRSEYSKYKEKKINDSQLVKTIKVLTEHFISEFRDKDSYRGIRDISEQIMTDCNKLCEMCMKDSLKLFESESGEVSKDLLKSAYSLFENGFVLDVETENIPIEITYPDMLMDDPLNTAKVLKIWKEIGVASDDTLMTKAGFNPEQEKYLLKKQREENEKYGLDKDEKDKDKKGKEDDEDDEGAGSNNSDGDAEE